MRFSYELIAAALAFQRVLVAALPPQRRDVAKVQTIPLTVGEQAPTHVFEQFELIPS